MIRHAWRRRALASAVVVTLAAWVVPGTPAQAPTVQPSASHRIDVLVLDGDRAVTGLTASDFVVADDGKPRRIEAAAPSGHVAISLVVERRPGMHASERPALLSAATALLAALGNDDEAAVLTFADDVRVEVPLGRDISAARRSLLNLPAEPALSKHAVWDATCAGAALVSADGGRRVVGLFSDLDDDASWIGQAVALDRLAATGIVVDGIGVHVTDRVLPPLPWDDLARATSGATFDADAPGLPARLAQRLAQFRGTYRLTLAPPDSAAQPGYHRIAVTLPGRKVTIHAQAGYYQ